MPRPRQDRDDKVEFLQSPYQGDGQRLDIPGKLKYSNIIDPNSLPPCLSREENPRPEPDPEVFDIPESHWPAKDTELVPSYMGAEEVWNTCRKGTRGRMKNEIYRKKDTSVSGLKDDASELLGNDVTVSYSAEIEGALQKLERLPSMCREDAIKDMKPDFSDHDYKLIKSASHQRFRNYIDMIKRTYGDRDVGDPPETDDPRTLTRELKVRVENYTNNSGQTTTSNSGQPTTSGRRRRSRKQRFPLKTSYE